MILDVLYLSKAPKHLLEGHNWVVCKNLKKKNYNFFCRETKFAIKERTQVIRRQLDLFPTMEKLCHKINANQ